MPLERAEKRRYQGRRGATWVADCAHRVDTLRSVGQVGFRLPKVPFIGSERAQSMVEIALLLPMLVFLILAGGDLARAYALQLAVQNGARAGAEAAAIDNVQPGTAEAQARALDEMSRTPGMNSANAIVTVTFKKSDGTTDCSGVPTVADPCWVTVRVQYTFHTVTPWPLIPNTANFDRSTSMRTIKSP